jgi:hypothetical protein
MAMETLKNIAGTLGMLLCVILGLIAWVLLVTYGPYLTVVIGSYVMMIVIPAVLVFEGYRKLKYRQWCDHCRRVTFPSTENDRCKRCTLKREDAAAYERNVR